MSKVNTYKSYNQAIKTALAWKEMIGKEQTRTTAKGVTGKLNKFIADLEVNYQETDGATNYHRPPNEFLAAMNEVLMENRHVLIGKAFEVMEAKRKSLLQEAQDEYTALMQEV